MERSAFLAKVRNAAQRGAAYRVHACDIPAGTGYVGATGDLCEQLAAEVNAVGGEGVIVDDQRAAGEALRDLLSRYQVRSALCWEHAALERIGVRAILDAAGVAAYAQQELATRSLEEQRATILACDLGITSVDVAIAETGTLMLCSRAERPRTASLVPPVHVAIVERGQIVPDLFDALTRLQQLRFDELPSNVTLITGPSKTGDIELQLTTGVHGPGKWHVVVIR